MGFLSNLFGGKTSEVEQPATEDGRTAEASPQAAPVATVLCPVSGTVMDISEVNDPVFAGKAMGDGIAIVPSEGVLVAPISGTVEALFPTGHALAIKDEAGMGVMLHIGIDTVDMKGDGFIARIAQGDRVEAGQILVEFDREKIAAAGFEDDDDGRHRARLDLLIGQVPCWRRRAVTSPPSPDSLAGCSNRGHSRVYQACLQQQCRDGRRCGNRTHRRGQRYRLWSQARRCGRFGVLRKASPSMTPRSFRASSASSKAFRASTCSSPRTSLRCFAANPIPLSMTAFSSL